MYPTVNFFKKYRIGHPVKIYNPKSYDSKWFGFVQCKIKAPRGLHHPVLPVRLCCGKSDKFFFTLCRTCAITQRQEKCNHTNDERALSGTWCTNEIALALQKGYRILEIYEVWHFTGTTDTLFRGYVRDFMRIKMENSEPPKEDITVFKQKVKDHLDIDLDEIKYKCRHATDNKTLS